MTEPFRFEPTVPAHAMKTYRIASPLPTHWRTGTCAEVDCTAQAGGWRSVIDETTDLGQRQAHYIRTLSGRKFVDVRTESGSTEFLFEAGQECFATHQVPLDRPEMYVVQGGDWRGDPSGQPPLVHSGPDAWLNDFGSHQQKIADIKSRG